MTKHFTFKSGFSLIELLISLIIISVIVASFTPIITQKLKHGGISVGNTKLSMKCPDEIGEECTLCLGNQCVACPITCGSEFRNLLTCKCESCKVENCVNCNGGSDKCDKCEDRYQLNGDTCELCPVGTYWNGSACQKCSPGYYSDTVNADGCIPCPKGTAQPNYGATSCSSCNGVNQYQSQTGQSGCAECWDQSKPNADHTNCDWICVPASSCSSSQYHDGCRCKDCSSGYHINASKTGCDPDCDVAHCQSCYSPNYCSTCNTNYKALKGECIYNPCPTYNAVLVAPFGYANPTTIEKFCMKKYNAGDMGEDYLQGISTGTNNPSTNAPYCWTGLRTAVSCTEQTELSKLYYVGGLLNWDYEGCNRTVCNWYAAEKICENMKNKTGKNWHLPTYDQLLTLYYDKGNVSEDRGTSGLQLCGNDFSNARPRCEDVKASQCMGARYNYCFPRYVWGENGYTFQDKGCCGGIEKNNAASVRCVLDL